MLHEFLTGLGGYPVLSLSPTNGRIWRPTPTPSRRAHRRGQREAILRANRRDHEAPRLTAYDDREPPPRAPLGGGGRADEITCG